MSYTLQHRVIVITGAARGIGLAAAKAFLSYGSKVVICDVDATTGEQRAKELGDAAFFYRLDVSDRKSFQNAMDQIEEEVGAIDVLINNAGIMPIGSFQEQDEESEYRQVQINLLGPVHGIHAVPDQERRDRRSP